MLCKLWEAISRTPCGNYTAVLLIATRRDCSGRYCAILQAIQTLALKDGVLEGVELAELAPALYPNTSIKVLDISRNDESANLLRSILCSNKSMIALDLSLSENKCSRRLALVSVLQRGWAAIYRYSRSTLRSVP
jgi:hypothetical protein